MKTRLVPLMLLLAVARSWADDADEALFLRAQNAFDRSLYVEALSDLTELVYRSPASPLAEKSRLLIWEIGDRLRKMEDRWNLTPQERKEFVRDAQGEKSSRTERRAEALKSLSRMIARGNASREELLDGLGGGALAVPLGRGVEALKLQERLERLWKRLDRRRWSVDALREAEGFAALERGDLEGAVREWTGALAAAPEDAGLQEYLRRISSRWKTGRAEAGKEGAGARRASLEEKKRRASVLAAGKDPLGAAALLMEVLQAAPDDKEALALLAGIKERLARRPGTGRGSGPRPARKKPSADRTSAEEAYTLGMAHYVRGNPDKALAFFEKAHRLDPSFEEAARAVETVRRERGAP